MFPMTDDAPKGDMPDMEPEGPVDLLRKALEMSGVKGEKLNKLTDAIDTWKRGDDAKLKECADGYEGKDDSPGESDDATEDGPQKDEKPKDEKPKMPPFGGKNIAEKEDSAIRRATMKFGG